MTSSDRFTVRGKRVIVVGAARSGVAAAELLVRRGASVTLTDVRPQIADEERLRSAGVNRVSLGAQSFQPELLRVLERRATPADVERAFGALRAAGFDNISLDLMMWLP